MLFPNQNIPESEKTPEWAISCVEAIDLGLSVNNNRYYEKLRFNRLYNGYIDYYDDDQFKYLTDFITTVPIDGFTPDINGFIKTEQIKQTLPARLIHIPIIRPLIDSLIGEECERPISFSIISQSDDVIKEKHDSKMDRFSQSLMNSVLEYNEEVKYLEDLLQKEQAIAQQYQQAGTQPLPSEINPFEIQLKLKKKKEALEEKLIEFEEFYNLDDKHVCEMQATHLLNYLIYYHNIKKLFIDSLADNIVYGEQAYKIEVRNKGEIPKPRVVNQLSISYPYNSNDDDVANCPYIKETVWMSKAEVIDNFSEYLTDEQVNILEMLTQVGGTNNTFLQNVPNNIISSWGTNSYGENRIRVVYVEWKSIRKVPVVRHTTSEGFVMYKVLNTEKVPNKDIRDGNVEYRYIQEVWEGVKIHTNMFVKVRKRPFQCRRLDNLSYTPLSYTGIMYSNNNSLPLSILSNCEKLQTLYDIVSYHLQILLATSGTRGQVIDTAQIPKGMDLGAVIYWRKRGMQLINSMEDDMDIPRSHAFNQFQTFDDTISGDAIRGLRELMDVIVAQVTKMVGVSDSRRGQVQEKALVGTTERSVAQSALNTAHRFFNFYEGNRRMLHLLLEFARESMKDSSGMYQYVLNGQESNPEAFRLDGQLLNMSFYGIMLSNTAKDIQSLTELKQMANAAMSAGTLTFSEGIELFRSSDINLISRKFQFFEKRNKRLLKEQEEAKLQMQQQQVAAQQKAAQDQLQQTVQFQNAELQHKINIGNKELEISAGELEIKKQTIDLQREIHQGTLRLEIQKLETSIRLQELQIQNKQIEIESKSNLERMKLSNDLIIKEKEFDLAKELENMKIQIKEKESENKLTLDQFKTIFKIESERELSEIKKDRETHSFQMELLKDREELNFMMKSLKANQEELNMKLEFLEKQHLLKLAANINDIALDQKAKEQSIESKKEPV